MDTRERGTGGEAERRRRPFENISDLRIRARLSTDDLRTLIKAGACDGIAGGMTRPMLLWAVDSEAAGKRGSGEAGLLPRIPASPPLPDYSAERRRQDEYAALGFLTAHHPMALYADRLRRFRLVRSPDLPNHVGQTVLLAGMLTTAKPVHTAADEPMQFATFDDGDGLVETVLFPEVYHKRGHVLFDQGPVPHQGQGGGGVRGGDGDGDAPRAGGTDAVPARGRERGAGGPRPAYLGGHDPPHCREPDAPLLAVLRCAAAGAGRSGPRAERGGIQAGRRRARRRHRRSPRRAAIPLAEIPVRAEAVEARLDEIRQILPRDRAICQIEDAYAATQDTIRALMELERRPGQERPTKRSLTDMHNEWARRIGQMRAWQKTVSERTNALSGHPGGAGPPANVLAPHDGGGDSGRKASPDVIQLVQGRAPRPPARWRTASPPAGRASSGCSRRSRGRWPRCSRRTTRSTSSSLPCAGTSCTSTRLRCGRDWAPTGAVQGLGATSAPRRCPGPGGNCGYFFETYRLRIYLHLASTLAILFGRLLVPAASWNRTPPNSRPTRRGACSITPVASSALIIALAVLVFYPRAPLSVYDLALLATVPAVLRLLPSFLPLVPDPARRRGLAPLRASSDWAALLLSGSAFQRPGSLVVSRRIGRRAALGCSAGAARWSASGRHAYAVALRVAARLSAAALLVAAASNVVGNVSLALFLTSGVLSSTYLLLVVLTAVRVADGVLIVSTRSQAAGISRFVSQRKDVLVRGGLRLINLAAAAGWVVLTLWLFELWAPTVSLARSVLAASLSFGELSVSLGSALVFLTTVWVSVLVSRGTLQPARGGRPLPARHAARTPERHRAPHPVHAHRPRIPLRAGGHRRRAHPARPSSAAPWASASASACRTS